MPLTEDDLSTQLLEHVEALNNMHARQSSHQSSVTISELAQAKSGYLIYQASRRLEKSTRRTEIASYALAILTLILIILTTVLVLKH